MTESSKDSKLTISKRKWAEQGKFLTGRVATSDADRLPPGQRLVKNWPVLDLGQRPSVCPPQWKLEIDTRPA
jgi:DMSO/TMAO reductase YedYZ molybdopterin-dependent catalytic subunit